MIANVCLLLLVVSNVLTMPVEESVGMPPVPTTEAPRAGDKDHTHNGDHDHSTVPQPDSWKTDGTVIPTTKPSDEGGDQDHGQESDSDGQTAGNPEGTTNEPTEAPESDGRPIDEMENHEDHKNDHNQQPESPQPDPENPEETNENPKDPEPENPTFEQEISEVNVGEEKPDGEFLVQPLDDIEQESSEENENKSNGTSAENHSDHNNEDQLEHGPNDIDTSDDQAGVQGDENEGLTPFSSNFRRLLGGRYRGKNNGRVPNKLAPMREYVPSTTTSTTTTRETTRRQPPQDIYPVPKPSGECNVPQHQGPGWNGNGYPQQPNNWKPGWGSWNGPQQPQYPRPNWPGYGNGQYPNQGNSNGQWVWHGGPQAPNAGVAFPDESSEEHAKKSIPI